MDDFPTGGILQVILVRDCPATWHTGIHDIRHGSQVYDTLLEKFPKGHGDTIDDEHCFSSTDIWSVGDDHIGFRGHATSMRPGS